MRMHYISFQLRSLSALFFGSSLVLAAVVALAPVSQAAATSVVTGSVLYPNTTGVADYEVELVASDGGTIATATTNSSGVYTLSAESSVVLNQQLTVRASDTPPTGYNNPGSNTYVFTFTGSVHTAATFTLITATKFIDVTVVDDQGTLRELDVTATPLFQTLNTGASEHIGSQGTMSVSESGKYLVTGDCNLSSSASQCPFINISGGQVIEFVEAADVTETISVTMMLTFAPITVTGQFLDKDGNNIYNGTGFQPDITFTGYNKDYGVVSTRRKVNSSGIAEVKLIPGVWTIMPSTGELGEAYNSQTFYPADATFVIAQEALGDDPGSFDFGSVQAELNAATISGTLNNGEEHPGMTTVVATNTTTRRRFDTTSDAAGNFTLSNLPYGAYAVTVESTTYIPVDSAFVTVSEEAPNATGVQVEVIDADVTITGSVTDGTTAMTYLPAAIVATAENGQTYTAPVDQDGGYELHLSSDQVNAGTVELQLLTQPGSDAYLPAPAEVTIAAGQTTTTDLVVSETEVTIGGSFVDAQGGAVAPADLGAGAKVMAINLSTGSVEEANVDSAGNWQMEVGLGDWQVIPQVTDPSAGVLTNDMSSQTLEVTAGASLTSVELPVQETVGTVSGTITNPSDEALSEVPVLFTNLPALQAEAALTGEAIDQSAVVQVSTTTEADGSYSQALPAGEFTAYFLSNPEITEFVEAPADTFTMKADKAVTIDAAYTEAAKTLEGKVRGEDLESVSVVAYRPESGMQELTVDVDSNTFSGDLTKGEWTIVTSAVKEGNLFTSEDTIKVTGDSTELKTKPTNTGVEIPAAVSTSGSVMSPIVLSNTAGATVSIPAYAAGSSGNVTVELVPDPQVIVNAGTTQVGLAYDVNVVDNTADRVVTQLNRPVTISMPLDEGVAGDVAADEVNAAFYDPQLQAYLSDGMTAQTNGDELVLTTTHLTRFSATTLSVAADDVPGKPRKLDAKKLTDSGARITWNSKSIDGVITHYVVQVREFGVKAKKKWDTYKQVTAERKLLKKLDAATRYEFRVKSCNDTGCSAYAKWTKFKTKP